MENLYWNIGAKGLISEEDNQLFIYVRPLSFVYTTTLYHMTSKETFLFPFREKETFIIDLSCSTRGIIDQFARTAS